MTEAFSKKLKQLIVEHAGGMTAMDGASRLDEFLDELRTAPGALGENAVVGDVVSALFPLVREWTEASSRIWEALRAITFALRVRNLELADLISTQIRIKTFGRDPSKRLAALQMMVDLGRTILLADLQREREVKESRLSEWLTLAADATDAEKLHTEEIIPSVRDRRLSWDRLRNLLPRLRLRYAKDGVPFGDALWQMTSSMVPSDQSRFAEAADRMYQTGLALRLRRQLIVQRNRRHVASRSYGPTDIVAEIVRYPRLQRALSRSEGTALGQ